MDNKNSVFIAKSLDGYIANKNGGIEWLHSIPNPDNSDMGYNAFIERIDALVMGRKTLEVVLGFGIPWPYTKPVFVFSNTLTSLPDNLNGKVELVSGSLYKVLAHIHKMGMHKLYIDGGTVIQSFLKEDLIDEMILSTIPVLLGDGIPLFGMLSGIMKFEYVKSEVFLDAITQVTYQRIR